MPAFGEVLKALREQAGLSQKALAEQAGTSQKAISFWESGEREPALSNLRKLCVALGVTCEVFFAADEPAADKRKAPVRRRKGK